MSILVTKEKWTSFTRSLETTQKNREHHQSENKNLITPKQFHTWVRRGAEITLFSLFSEPTEKWYNIHSTQQNFPCFLYVNIFVWNFWMNFWQFSWNLMHGNLVRMNLHPTVSKFAQPPSKLSRAKIYCAGCVKLRICGNLLRWLLSPSGNGLDEVVRRTR